MQLEAIAANLSSDQFHGAAQRRRWSDDVRGERETIGWTRLWFYA
jgi:hypothetical protein